MKFKTGELSRPTEWEAFERILAELEGKPYHDGESVSLQLFYQSIGLLQPAPPKIFTVAKPQVQRITAPVLVMGEGAVCYLDRADLSRRLYDKERKGYWNGMYIRNTLQR